MDYAFVLYLFNLNAHTTESEKKDLSIVLDLDYLIPTWV